MKNVFVILSGSSDDSTINAVSGDVYFKKLDAYLHDTAYLLKYIPEVYKFADDILTNVDLSNSEVIVAHCNPINGNRKMLKSEMKRLGLMSDVRIFIIAENHAAVDILVVLHQIKVNVELLVTITPQASFIKRLPIATNDRFMSSTIRLITSKYVKLAYNILLETNGVIQGLKLHANRDNVFNVVLTDIQAITNAYDHLSKRYMLKVPLHSNGKGQSRFDVKCLYYGDKTKLKSVRPVITDMI